MGSNPTAVNYRRWMGNTGTSEKVIQGKKLPMDGGVRGERATARGRRRSKREPLQRQSQRHWGGVQLELFFAYMDIACVG